MEHGDGIWRWGGIAKESGSVQTHAELWRGATSDKYIGGVERKNGTGCRSIRKRFIHEHTVIYGEHADTKTK
jgi:hypothetical protein